MISMQKNVTSLSGQRKAHKPFLLDNSSWHHFVDASLAMACNNVKIDENRVNSIVFSFK